MRVAVVGGKLQGLEAVYLAKKAGWEVILIDHDPSVPAAGLCDSFLNFDVNRLVDLTLALKKVDLVIPALEDREALGMISRCANYLKVPVLFDAQAYEVSSSKIKSNELFSLLKIPAPVPWPDCGFPVIAKPSESSGSKGVIKINDQQEFQHFRNTDGAIGDWIIEEYLEGPSFSLEVVGFAGNYKVLQITELHMDQDYDCKRVLAPAALDPLMKNQFEKIALVIARSLGLNGIMDVETILHNGKLKVLEIDARLPSQTPAAVYKSTGLNMLELLAEPLTLNRAWRDFEVRDRRGVVYEHILAAPGKLEVCGEHIMAGTSGLALRADFFGADEAITDYAPGKNNWVATLMVSAIDLPQAREKRDRVIRRIAAELGLNEYLDSVPAGCEQGIQGRGVSRHYDETA